MASLFTLLRRAAGAALLALAATPLPAAAPTEIELVLDASGSMWNKLEDGRYRIDAAKAVLTDFIAQVPANPNLRIGLRIYGARVHYSKPGACEDSVLVAPIAALDRPRLLKEVRETRAVGATPLAHSLNLAAQDFRESGKKQVIVCTDGEESCGGDVAAAVAALKALGADVDVRFIGIGLPAAAAQRLAQIAPIENVNSAAKLAEALRTATRPAIEGGSGKPAPGVQVRPTPTPAPKIGTVAVRVVRDRKAVPAPEAAVTFRAELGSGAGVELKAAGEEFTGSLPAGSYTATVKPGGRTFTALAVVADTKNPFTFDLTEAPKVTVTPAKSTALGGTRINVSFSGAKAVRDQFLAVAPLGSPDSEEADYVWVEGASGSAELNMPDKPGEYEFRFTSRVAEDGPYVVSGRSGPVKVTAATASIDAPARADAGAPVQIRWTGPNRSRDWVGFIKKGGGVGDYLTYAYAEGEAKEAEVYAPGTAGEYDVIYGNDNSGAVLARRPITVVQPAMGVSGPATAMAGADVKVSWTGPLGRGQYVTIVRTSAEPGTYNEYVMLSAEERTVELSAPEETGEFEIRLASDHTRTVLARAPIRLTPAIATLDAPATAKVGEAFTVKATGPMNRGDHVVLAKVGAPDDDTTDYFVVRDGTPKLTPSAAGSYELRYRSKEGKILLRKPLTVK